MLFKHLIKHLEHIIAVNTDLESSLNGLKPPQTVDHMENIASVDG